MDIRNRASISEDEQLETKKQYARYVAEVICKYRGLQAPNLNFHWCQDEEENQLAHYHPDTNTICISTRQLNSQTFDDLRDTIIHETAHIRMYGHDDPFNQEKFLNFMVVGELSIESFLLERDKAKNIMDEIISIKINNERFKFKVPAKVYRRKMRITTSYGLDYEYVMNNSDLSINGFGVTENIAKQNFLKDFMSLCEWCWSEDTVARRIQKDRLRAFIVE